MDMINDGLILLPVTIFYWVNNFIFSILEAPDWLLNRLQIRLIKNKLFTSTSSFYSIHWLFTSVSIVQPNRSKLKLVSLRVKFYHMLGNLHVHLSEIILQHFFESHRNKIVFCAIIIGLSFCDSSRLRIYGFSGTS